MHDESQAQSNGIPIDSSQENHRLRETVKRLEAERDEYKAALYSVLRARTKVEEIDIPDENDCQTFDQFLPELEQLLSETESGTHK